MQVAFDGIFELVCVGLRWRQQYNAFVCFQNILLLPTLKRVAAFMSGNSKSPIPSVGDLKRIFDMTVFYYQVNIRFDMYDCTYPCISFLSEIT